VSPVRAETPPSLHGSVEAPVLGSGSWLGVELRHLAALAALARAGSFRAAADELGYVQSAVSQQLARLEGLVGARLVERSRGSAVVRLTDAGALLLGHVDGIMARFAAAEADLAGLAQGVRGSLRVGVFESVATRLLPRIVPVFSQRWLQVRLVAHEAQTDADLFGPLERGELELAFCDLPCPAGPFESLELLSEPMVLLVQSGSPLAKDGTPSLAELSRLPLIAHSGRRHMRQIEDRLAAAGGARPEFVHHSNTNSVVHALVAAGAGVSITPKLAVDPHQNGVTALELGSALPPLVIALAWHNQRKLTTPMRGFCELAQQACAEVAQLDPALRDRRSAA
jgi:DNA-binding transcriptional LysR family regulator